MLAPMRTIRVALAQIAPSLGRLDVNLARHHELIEAARAEQMVDVERMVSEVVGG